MSGGPMGCAKLEKARAIDAHPGRAVHNGFSALKPLFEARQGHFKNVRLEEKIEDVTDF
jgi:hypothetical protein